MAIEKKINPEDLQSGSIDYVELVHSLSSSVLLELQAVIGYELKDRTCLKKKSWLQRMFKKKEWWESFYFKKYSHIYPSRNRYTRNWR